MKKLTILFAIALFLSCSTNPFTGKSTLALVPNSQLFPMAFQEYSSFLSENKVVSGTKDAQMVKTLFKCKWLCGIFTGLSMGV